MWLLEWLITRAERVYQVFQNWWGLFVFFFADLWGIITALGWQWKHQLMFLLVSKFPHIAKYVLEWYAFATQVFEGWRNRINNVFYTWWTRLHYFLTDFYVMLSFLVDDWKDKLKFLLQTGFPAIVRYVVDWFARAKLVFQSWWGRLARLLRTWWRRQVSLLRDRWPRLFYILGEGWPRLFAMLQSPGEVSWTYLLDHAEAFITKQRKAVYNLGEKVLRLFWEGAT